MLIQGENKAKLFCFFSVTFRQDNNLTKGIDPLTVKAIKQLLHSSLKLLKSTLSWVVAVVIATELKHFQLNFINCDDHICV